jgi:alkylated DNA nucleotide flippase Atl1
MAARKLTPFLIAVRRTILKIPRGKTMSYGRVAEVSGVPNGARAVVRALHSLDDIPWWRVCRAGEKFAPQTMPLQEQLLRQEGWEPPPKKSSENSPRKTSEKFPKPIVKKR